MIRRHCILLGTISVVAAFAGDPWKKKPEQWSPKDVEEIISHSPWAQTRKVEFKYLGEDVEGPRSGGVVGPPTGPPGGNGNVGPPGGGPSRAGGGIRQTGPGALPEFRSLVRWESALPVRLALKRENDLKPDVYRIAVVGFPILKKDIKVSLDALSGSARIDRDGKSPLRPLSVHSRESDNALVFTFDGQSDPITKDDRDVVFAIQYGNLNLTVRFNLKDMIYEHRLAL